MSETPCARDFMVTDVLTLPVDLDIEQAAARLDERGVASAPVVEDGAHLVGYLSEADCLEHLAATVFHGAPTLSVAQAMQRHPLCVSADVDLFALASIFTQHGLRHLPVVDGRVLLGVVARRDVLRALRRIHVDGEHAKAPDLDLLVNHRFLAG